MGRGWAWRLPHSTRCPRDSERFSARRSCRPPARRRRLRESIPRDSGAGRPSPGSRGGAQTAARQLPHVRRSQPGLQSYERRPPQIFSSSCSTASRRHRHATRSWRLSSAPTRHAQQDGTGWVPSDPKGGRLPLPIARRLIRDALCEASVRIRVSPLEQPAEVELELALDRCVRA